MTTKTCNSCGKVKLDVRFYESQGNLCTTCSIERAKLSMKQRQTEGLLKEYKKSQIFKEAQFAYEFNKRSEKRKELGAAREIKYKSTGLYQYCSTCDKFHDIGLFNPDRSKSKCRYCLAKERRSVYKPRKLLKYQYCPSCESYLLKTKFSASKARSSGLQAYCKKCSNVIRKRYAFYGDIAKRNERHSLYELNCTKDMKDPYIKRLLKDEGYTTDEINPELIFFKRKQLELFRLQKELK
jgi:hypothetical protein